MAAVSPLKSGAVWRGHQTSGQTRYEVEVRICSVDSRGDLAGTLTIRNLTPSLPKVVTYFDGEIIGKHHSFVTDKWDASSEDDKRHWGRFRRDLGIKGSDSLDDGVCNQDSDFVFMRLKERCIIDAGSDADVSGASFAGFYYIAVDLRSAAKAEEHSATTSTASDSYFTPGARGRSPSSNSTTSLDTSASLRRPLSGLSLVRSNSYAAVVRGSSPVFTSHSISAAHGNLKSEDSIHTSVESVASSLDSGRPFSPSLDEYPLPSSPPASSSALSPVRCDRPSSPRSRGVQRASSNDRTTRSSSSFYNARTGYRGVWAHATMKGFYFASSSDPYQELELSYVGDGMGALLEEHAEGIGGVDEWGNQKPIDTRSVLAKELRRRERYAAPRGSATFTLL